MASQQGSLEGAWGLMVDDEWLMATHVGVSDPELVLSFISKVTAAVVEVEETRLRASMSSVMSSVMV